MALSSGCDPGQGYKGASVSAGHGAHLGEARRWRSEEVGSRVFEERRLEVTDLRFGCHLGQVTSCP